MSQELNFKPKIRVSLLDFNGAVLSDRLVDSYPEFLNGPKISHNGPIRIEITLTNKQETESFKNYLDQLQGTLPLKETTGRGRPATSAQEIESPREDIYMQVEKMVNEGQNQDAIIKYLRDLGFVFLLTEDLLQYFSDFPFKSRDIGEPNGNHQYPHSLSWLTRCIKRGKDPKTDKFDPLIIFGFSILEGNTTKVVPYLYKERKKPLKIELGKETLTPNQVEFTKMPPYMLESERLKFSFEQRQLILNPEKQPSKFFLRWASEVKVPTAAYKALKERVPSIKCLKN